MPAIPAAAIKRDVIPAQTAFEFEYFRVMGKARSHVFADQVSVAGEEAALGVQGLDSALEAVF